MRKAGTIVGVLAVLLLAVAVPVEARDCPQCMFHAPDGTRFCPQCGHEFSVRKTCTACGESAAGEARFCAQCGERYSFTPEDEDRFIADVLASRTAYLEALAQLNEFYQSLGMAEKAGWVRAEATDVRESARVEPPRPAAATGGAGEAGGPAGYPAQEGIEEADTLYAEALAEWQTLSPFRRATHIARAKELFESLLLRFPLSDKTDEAAYYLGRILESQYFQDYPRAVDYYVECYARNPDTGFDARFRAARVADQLMRDSKRAIPLYEALIEHGRGAPAQIEEARRRVEALRARLAEENGE